MLVRDHISLGRIVRQHRRSQGLTQQVLSDRAGVSRFWLVQLEGGKLPNVQYSQLRQTLLALNLTLHIEPAHDRDSTLDDILGGA